MAMPPTLTEIDRQIRTSTAARGARSARVTQTPAACELPPREDREAADIVALAAAVGLPGFSDSSPKQMPISELPADTAEQIVALAKRVGLKGFVE